MSPSDDTTPAAHPNAVLEAAREWHRLGVEAEELLGANGWSLLRSYGRLMSGPYSGSYVSALPSGTYGCCYSHSDEVNASLFI